MNEIYIILLVMFFIFSIIFSRVMQNVLSEKYKTQTKIAKIKASKAKTNKSTSESEPNYPDWLLDFGDDLGVDLEDYLGLDEIPPELERLKPLAKAFIKNGGLDRLLKSQKTLDDTVKTDETTGDFI